MTIELADCQAVGCNALAMPWPVRLGWDDIEVEVYLCRRCELDLQGKARKPEEVSA